MRGLAVVGAGVTGLAAGLASGAPVFEASDGPGGLCRTVYVTPDGRRSDRAPDDDDAYRFEHGGGHWIFGSDPEALALLESLAPLTRYDRRASVRLGGLGLTVPYPLQAHPDRLGPHLGGLVAADRERPTPGRTPAATLGGWLRETFGPALCDAFFTPFHDRYTGGLTERIAPQDGYKSPVPGGPGPAGYNAEFRYPVGGLDQVVRSLAAGVDVRYGRHLVAIDVTARLLRFADGTVHPFAELVSTLPLHVAVDLAGVEVPGPPDPHTSVLVVNLAAGRGPACPDVHWQYEPDAAAGFHRLGFYSNVERGFLPAAERDDPRTVSLYVERAWPSGAPPGPAEVARYVDDVVAELQARRYIADVLVADPSWVEVAYTWRWVGSQWREAALAALADAGIHQIGRYGAWHFQGIAESIGEGLELGAKLGAGS